MKICLIAPLFDPWNIGGAEKYAKTLAHELSKNNEVVVITSVGPSTRKKQQLIENPKVIEIKPINVSTLYEMITHQNSVGIGKKLIWNFSDIWNISSYRKIKDILKKEKPDIVHTNGIKGFSSSIFSAIKDVGIPLIHTLHDYELISRWVGLFRNGNPIEKFNSLEHLYIYYQRKMSDKIDVVISPSNFAMKIHEKWGFFKKTKKQIIPNGFKLNINQNPKEIFNSEFLFLGQVLETKGPQIAINAFKKIPIKNSKLHIVGKGSFLKEAKSLAKNDSGIIFYDYLKEKEIDLLMDQCSYFLLPSIWYENFPLTINEAMNKGLPVIASNIGGIPELVKDGFNGFLFKPNDVNSLKELLQTVIKDKEKFSTLSKNAIDSSKKFSLDSQMKMILEIYDQQVNCT